MEKYELDEKITKVSKTILSYCLSRTSNRNDAEDLAQEMILEIIKASQNIRDEKAFYGFLWSIAGNVYKQWYKKKLRINECELNEEIQADAAELDLLNNEDSDIYLLRRELSFLSEKYRKATILYYIKNKSCNEISELLSVSESMVKYLLFKSRKLLKEGINMNRSYGEQSYGEHAYIWGVEQTKSGFNCCSIKAEEWHTDISIYFMDWVTNPQTNHNDFYSNNNFVKVYSKLARGIVTDTNEFEQEIVAELIRRGYAFKKNGKILVTMPVFTKEEYEKLIIIISPVIDETAKLFEEINNNIIFILRNHAPLFLKKQVEAIAGMSLFDEGAYVPALVLNKSGYLSADWDANENATSYVVLS